MCVCDSRCDACAVADARNPAVANADIEKFFRNLSDPVWRANQINVQHGEIARYLRRRQLEEKSYQKRVASLLPDLDAPLEVRRQFIEFCHANVLTLRPRRHRLKLRLHAWHKVHWECGCARPKTSC